MWYVRIPFSISFTVFITEVNILQRSPFFVFTIFIRDGGCRLFFISINAMLVKRFETINCVL